MSKLQVVILAAGRGTRMGHLTDLTPKPLLEVGGQTILEHTLSVLPNLTDKITIVIGYLGELIKDKIGNEYKGIPIEYFYQKELNGTGGALWQIKSQLTGEKYLVLGGDDWFDNLDLEEISKNDLAIGVSLSNVEVKYSPKVNNGILCGFDANGHNLCVGAYLLDNRIFDYSPVQLSSGSEFGLPQTLSNACQHLQIKVVRFKNWKQINTPEQLEKARTK